jgi:phosphatidylinositol-3-phosphatase
MRHTQEAPSAAVPLGDQYATRHDLSVYFHSTVDSPDCAKNVGNLNNLTSDLKSIDTTANFNLITPNTCDDGHDAPCVNGQPGGLTSADAFLKKWVPIITASPAFQKDGLLIVNFDESSYATVTASAKEEDLILAGTTCCSQQPGPNLGTFPQTSSLAYQGMTINLTKQSFGGDQTGAVMISKFIKPGTVSTVQYNHYSMLKSIEDIFQLGHLGYAGQAGLVGFGSDIFTNL